MDRWSLPSNALRQIDDVITKNHQLDRQCDEVLYQQYAAAATAAAGGSGSSSSALSASSLAAAANGAASTAAAAAANSPGLSAATERAVALEAQRAAAHEALAASVAQLGTCFDGVLLVDSLFDHFLHIVSLRPKCLAAPPLLKAVTDAFVSLWHRSTPEEIAVPGVRHVVRFLHEVADLVDCSKAAASPTTAAAASATTPSGPLWPSSSTTVAMSPVTSGGVGASAASSPTAAAAPYPSAGSKGAGVVGATAAAASGDVASAPPTTPASVHSGALPPSTVVRGAPLVLSATDFAEQFTIPVVASLLDILANFVMPDQRDVWFERELTAAATAAVLRVVSLVPPEMLSENAVADVMAITQAVNSNLRAVSCSRAGWRVTAALVGDVVRGIEARKFVAGNFEALAAHAAGSNVVTALLDGGSGTPMPRSLCRRLLSDSGLTSAEHNGCRLPALVAIAMDGVGCEVMNNALHQTRGLFSLVFADVLRRFQSVIASCGPHTAQVMHWAQAQPSLEDCLVLADPALCDEECIVPRRLVAYTEAVSRWTRSLSKLRRFEEEVFSASQQATPTRGGGGGGGGGAGAGVASMSVSLAASSVQSSSLPFSGATAAMPAISPGSAASPGANRTRMWLDRLQSLFELPELCMEQPCRAGPRCPRVHLESDADVNALRSSASNRAGLFSRTEIARRNVPLTVVVPETGLALQCTTAETEPTPGLLAYLDKEWPVGIPLTADQLCAKHAAGRCAHARQCRYIHTPAHVFRAVLAEHSPLTSSTGAATSAHPWAAPPNAATGSASPQSCYSGYATSTVNTAGAIATSAGVHAAAAPQPIGLAAALELGALSASGGAGGGAASSDGGGAECALSPSGGLENGNGERRSVASNTSSSRNRMGRGGMCAPRTERTASQLTPTSNSGGRNAQRLGQLAAAFLECGAQPSHHSAAGSAKSQLTPSTVIIDGDIAPAPVGSAAAVVGPSSSSASPPLRDFRQPLLSESNAPTPRLANANASPAAHGRQPAQPVQQQQQQHASASPASPAALRDHGGDHERGSNGGGGAGAANGDRASPRRQQHNPYAVSDDRSSTASNGRQSTTTSSGTALSTIIARHVRAIHGSAPSASSGGGGSGNAPMYNAAQRTGNDNDGGAAAARNRGGAPPGPAFVTHSYAGAQFSAGGAAGWGAAHVDPSAPHFDHQYAPLVAPLPPPPPPPQPHNRQAPQGGFVTHHSHGPQRVSVAGVFVPAVSPQQQQHALSVASTPVVAAAQPVAAFAPRVGLASSSVSSSAATSGAHAHLARAPGAPFMPRGAPNGAAPPPPPPPPPQAPQLQLLQQQPPQQQPSRVPPPPQYGAAPPPLARGMLAQSSKGSSQGGSAPSSVAGMARGAPPPPPPPPPPPHPATQLAPGVAPASEHAAAPASEPKQRDCKYFRLGCCTQGAACRYRHNPDTVRFRPKDSAAAAAQ